MTNGAINEPTSDDAQPRVLLVEDNAVNAQIAQAFLKRFPVTVLVAENGQEAVEIVASNTVDIILMDVQMPVMDGLTATKKIRELDHYADTPIVAMTAAALDSDRELCFAAGMTDYISKPIMFDQLVAMLKEHAGIVSV